MAVLANPIAGRGRRAGILADVIGRLRAARLTPRLLRADTRQEALDACREAVAGQPQALVAVGGDGTVHLALQAVAGTPVPLGVVPVGTGNDFASAVGLPTGEHEAIKATVEAIVAGRSNAVDLARVTHFGAVDMWYGTVLSAGLDSSINERANRMRWPKGPRRYDLSILVEIARLAPRDYKLVLDGGEPQELSAMIIAVGNGPTYGGGLRICPDADLHDGMLELTVIGPIGRPAAVRLKSLVRRGIHLRHPAVSHHRVATVEIHGPTTHTYADGERAVALPVSIECVAGAVRVLV